MPAADGGLGDVKVAAQPPRLSHRKSRWDRKTKKALQNTRNWRLWRATQDETANTYALEIELV